VTIAEAARRSGLSRATVLRRIAAGTVQAREEPDGSLSISGEAIALLRRREPAADDRVAVVVRVPTAEHAAFARKAGAQPVSSWLRGLARRALARAEPNARSPLTRRAMDGSAQNR
jgi:hypothetical protein